MYIEYTHPSPRAGAREHQTQTTASALIAAGLAREVILTDEEKKAHRFGVKPFVLPEVQWNVINSPHTGTLLIQRRCGTETTLFSVRPDKKWNCPLEIVKEFEARLERERLARIANNRDRDRAAESVLRGKV